MNVQDIFDSALRLSVDERCQLLEALELSITPTLSEIDQAWVAVAKQRLTDFESGKIQPLAKETVFSEIRSLFNDDNHLSS